MGVLGDIGGRLRPARFSADAEQFFEATSLRVTRRMSRQEWRGEAIVSTTFVIAAAVFALVAFDHRGMSVGVAIALGASIALLAHVEVATGSGFAVPTQLAFVPMLFLLPPWSVPLVVAAGLVFGRVLDTVRRGWHVGRAVQGIGESWFALGPAVVFAAAGIRGLHWGDWPVWIGAMAAQLVVDYGSSAVREWVRLGKRADIHLRELQQIWLVDLFLAPVGVLAAAASQQQSYAFLLVLPLVVLIAVFAQERRFRLEQAIDLSRAYQGTALLLGDLIEGDDNYTGEHSRGVVALAVEISDEFGLDARRRRLVEFGALLHDVGKVKVPKSILHKPGPLDPPELEVMRQHTIEGQKMLDRVGGDLEDVGLVVRASHEHWNGGGYPDGLAGEAIPLEARIVSCADAFSAMTTDRPYRKAMTLERAIGELSANAGTQFDPQVVEALLRVLARHAGAEQGAAAAAAIAAAAAVPVRS